MPPRQTFLCSKGKGNSRGLPSPPAPGPSLCPRPQLSLLAAPSSARPPRGGQRLPAVSNVHFLNQTNPPPARSPRPGAGAALSRAGIVGSRAPQEGPEGAPDGGGAVGQCPHRPPPAPSRRRSQTPELTHPQPHAPGRRPLPRLAEKEKLSKLSARPPPASVRLLRPALTSPGGLSVHAVPGSAPGVLAGGGGRRGSAPRTCRA